MNSTVPKAAPVPCGYELPIVRVPRDKWLRSGRHLESYTLYREGDFGTRGLKPSEMVDCKHGRVVSEENDINLWL